MKIIRWFNTLNYIVKTWQNEVSDIRYLIKDARNIAEDARDSAADSREFIKARTDVSVDMGIRGPSTVIVTGIYKNKEYVEVFDVTGEDFNYLINMLRDMQKHHRIKSIDAPYGFTSIKEFL